MVFRFPMVRLEFPRFLRVEACRRPRVVAGTFLPRQAHLLLAISPGLQPETSRAQLPLTLRLLVADGVVRLPALALLWLPVVGLSVRGMP